MTFEQRIEQLDLSLFDNISTQSSNDDRTSWLAMQRAIRSKRSPYTYLEIGSHLGGSIQQHVNDPLCRKIYSIDKRPTAQPDNRGQMYEYAGNSTEKMLVNLRAINPDRMPPLVCIDSDARDVPRASIELAPDFCFIDGEHTDQAVRSDFEFCLQVATKNAVIAFHDSAVIHQALARICKGLSSQGIPYLALKMPGDTFAICLRDCVVGGDARVTAMAEDGLRWLRRMKYEPYVERLCPGFTAPATRYVGRFVLNLWHRQKSAR